MNRPKSVERLRVAFAAACSLLFLTAVARSQDEPASKPEEPAASAPASRRASRRPPTAGGATFVIENARVLRAGKPDLEEASILVRGRRIVAVGKKVEIPQGARRIDAKGATVTAGWIDARGATPLDAASITEGIPIAPHQRATDGLDLVDQLERVRDALRRGVTAVYLAPGHGLMPGVGTLVKLHPHERDVEKLEVDDAEAMSFVGGSARGTSAVGRLVDVSTLRKTLRDAQKYREQIDQYNEDLAKFLEDRKKGLKPSSRPAEEPADRRTDSGPRPPAPNPRNRRPPRTDEERYLVMLARAIGILPVTEDRDGGVLLDESAEAGPVGPEEFDDHEKRPPGPPIPEYFFQGPAPEKKDEKTTERPKKPDFNAPFDALLPVLRRELPVRIEARRADEIRAAIALVRDFRLRAVIEGADEAELVLDELDESKIPVVIAPVRTLADQPQRLKPLRLASLLAERDIPFAIGTGRGFYGTQWLRAQVAEAVAGGLSRDAALAAVTADAAEILGLTGRIGAIEPGLEADLTVFDGDPFDPATEVRMTIVDGEVRFER